MKIFHAALAGAVLFSGAAFATEVTQTLEVSGWHCKGCSGKTEAAVKKVNGVKDVKADLDKKTVTVTFDDAATKKSDIEEAVKAQHYKVVGWK